MVLPDLDKSNGRISSSPIFNNNVTHSSERQGQDSNEPRATSREVNPSRFVGRVYGLKMPRTQTNASSLLLRLPQEIKDQIYRYIIGNKFLHMSEHDEDPELYFSECNQDSGKPPQFKNEICYAKLSEAEAQDYFEKNHRRTSEMSRTELEWYQEHVEDRHLDCRVEGDVHSSEDVALLLSCRQIFSEAHRIPYTTNVFSFDEPFSAHQFLTDLSRRNAADIRNLHFYVCTSILGDLESWEYVFKHVALMLRGVRNVYLDLRITNPQPLEYAYELQEEFRELKGLSLAPVTQIIIDRLFDEKCRHPKLQAMKRWTMEERRIKSEAVTEAILRRERDSPERGGEWDDVMADELDWEGLEWNGLEWVDPA